MATTKKARMNDQIENATTKDLREVEAALKSVNRLQAKIAALAGRFDAMDSATTIANTLEEVIEDLAADIEVAIDDRRRPRR